MIVEYGSGINETYISTKFIEPVVEDINLCSTKYML